MQSTGSMGPEGTDGRSTAPPPSASESDATRSGAAGSASAWSSSTSGSSGSAPSAASASEPPAEGRRDLLTRFGRPFAGALIAAVAIHLGTRLLGVLIQAAAGGMSGASMVNLMHAAGSLTAQLPAIVVCAMVIILSRGHGRLSLLGAIALLLVAVDHLSGTVLGSISSFIMSYGDYDTSALQIAGVIGGFNGVLHVVLMLGLLALGVIGLVRPALLGPRITIPVAAKVLAIALVTLTAVLAGLALLGVIIDLAIPSAPLLDIVLFMLMSLCMPLILIVATVLAVIGVGRTAGGAVAVLVLIVCRTVIDILFGFLAWQLIGAGWLFQMSDMVGAVLTIGTLVAAVLALFVQLRADAQPRAADARLAARD